jgi:hypothetical protein
MSALEQTDIEPTSLNGQAGTNRLLKKLGPLDLTLERESDSCAVERAAGEIDARFGYTHG